MRRITSVSTSILTACGLWLAAVVPPVAAHHSFAVHFVADHTVTVSGVVDAFRFTNPHGVLDFTVTGEDGMAVKWRAETNSPSVLRRRGWSRDSLKPGDRITITGFPSRDEGNYMRISVIEFEDGRPALRAQAAAD